MQHSEEVFNTMHCLQHYKNSYILNYSPLKCSRFSSSSGCVAVGSLVPSKPCSTALIKTHGSESRGQEEAGLRDEQVSYLQVAPL